MSCVSWLHLSDLHIGRDEYNETVVLNKLLEDVKNTISNNSIHLDLILITGDISFSGQKNQYASAKMFIDRLSKITGVKNDCIITVPGNHDVDRTQISPLCKLAAKEVDSRDTVTKLISSESARGQILQSLSNYMAFIGNKFPWATDTKKKPLSFTINKSINGIPVSILALNSAWLAFGRNDEKGNLVIGEKQVRDALEKCENSELTISLMHHPFSWLKWFDCEDVQGLLNKRADFILSGHEHRASLIGKGSVLGKAFLISAGATYEDRAQLNSYNIVKCNVDEGIATCYFREYVDKNGGYWTSDNSLGDTVENGEIVVKYRNSILVTESGQENKTDHTTNEQEEFEHQVITTQIKQQYWINPEDTKTEFFVPDLPPDLIDLIENKKCVLFAGAGTSIDAGIPGWDEMLNSMIERVEQCIGLDSEDKKELECLMRSGKYEVIAEYCKESLGNYDFADQIKRCLQQTQKPPYTHQLLAKIPFCAAITSNYDNLIEENHRNIKVILPQDLSQKDKRFFSDLFNGNQFPIIKIHGTIEDPSSIVLTDSDYRRVIFQSSSYRDNLREIFEDKSILFVGFSFRDRSINLLLQEIFTLTSGYTRPHYAFLPDVGNIEKDAFRSTRNIRVISYPTIDGQHIVLNKMLEKLSARFSS